MTGAMTVVGRAVTPALSYGVICAKTRSASHTVTRAAIVILLTLVALVPARAIAQEGVLRGTVTDTTGRPLAGVEVLSVNGKRSTRTDRNGRFALARLPFGQQLIMARYPGYQPADRAINMLDANVPELTFRLRRIVQLIDTVRIVSHDGCAAYDFTGFECRRRAGVGQFRGLEEIGALRPHFWADMFEGMPGFRNVQVPDPILGMDWDVESTTGWRCLESGWNGRERTANLENVRPADIVAIEHYDVYEKVPAAYKRLAWPNSQPRPCALVIYWTRDFIERQRSGRR
jgi:hypothetical protein